MGKRGRICLPAALVALALVVAGCGGSDEGSGEAAPKGGGTDTANTTPIKVGASLPLTGDFSEPGKDAKEGYEVWAKTVNDNGGLLGRPVELVIRDDSSDQNLIVSDYNHLISQENVDLLLGSFSSFLNLPASAVAERNKMLYVETAGGSPEMFERGFKYLFFTQNAIAERQADLFAEWVTGLPEGERPKTAGFLTIDDPFTKPVVVRMKKLLEEAGIKTLLDETYPPDTTNFDTVANSIKSKNPDVLVQGSVFNDGVGLVRSLIRVGYQPKQFFQTTAPTLGDQYSKAIGLGNTEGIFSALSWDEELKTDGNAEFVAAYEAMFEGSPPEDAAAGYANAQVVQAAVEAIGNVEDQTAMADWLRTNEVSTILGPLTWDEAGRPQGSYILAQWQDGGSEIVAPANLATTDTTVNVKPEWKK
jgi:branched-chain amino acid transport system substrate-binding protein